MKKAAELLDEYFQTKYFEWRLFEIQLKYFTSKKEDT